MLKRYDKILKKEEKIHEKVPADKGIYIELKEPDSFKKIFETEVEDDD